MEERIEHLIAWVTPEEKASLLAGCDFECYSEDEGVLEVLVGGSSRDIRLAERLRFKGDTAP